MNSIKKNLYNPLTKLVHELWAVLFPKFYVKYLYKKTMGKNLNLNNPKDLNEKIQWLKIYSDTTQWTNLADKYKVREYIEQCGLKDILVELYGVWEKADDIDFGKLPDKFVIKTNHGCGKNIIVKDKNQLDIPTTRKQLDIWLSERYGLTSFEPHYWKIPRKIIAEEFLCDESTAHISTSLIDYKFWCINGEPEIIMALYDRKTKSILTQENHSGPHMRACVFDLDWNLQPEIIAGPLANYPPKYIPKPTCLVEMINICKILAKPFPQVRVDLYEVYKKVYFGELTFTPGGGMNYFSDEYFLKLGEKMDLSNVEWRKSRWII